MPETTPPAAEIAKPDAIASKPPVRGPSRLMSGAVVLAAIAVFGYLGYHAYDFLFFVDLPAFRAANIGAGGRGGPAEAGIIGPDGAAGAPKRAKPVEAPAAAGAAAALVARPRTTDAGRGGEREPTRLEPCTEAVVALGLCAPKSIQRKE